MYELGVNIRIFSTFPLVSTLFVLLTFNFVQSNTSVNSLSAQKEVKRSSPNTQNVKRKRARK